MIDTEIRSNTIKWKAKLLKTRFLSGQLTSLGALILAVFVGVGGASAQEYQPLPQASYADLVSLADPAEIVLRAEIRKQAVVEPERSPGLRPGYVRLYIEARTLTLISGSVPVGESLRYVVDMPLDERGKVPKVKKHEVLLFARVVPGRTGDIQLVGPSAQLMWNADLESRLRPILTELAGPDSPPKITGIRDAISIGGNLVGESETQIFLSTDADQPVSISIIRRPGQRPLWGVSWSDIIDQAAQPPRAQSLKWYRLACSLPGRLPERALLSSDRASKSRTRSDYAFVLSELGECERLRN